MVLYSYYLVGLYMYVFGTIILYEIISKLCQNSFWTCYYMFVQSIWYFSINTETEPKVSKPNFLGTDFSKESIGT